MNSIKTIEFIPSSKDVELNVPHPVPAKITIPEWYKSIDNIDTFNLKFDTEGEMQKNVKMCVPFLDAMLTGYVQRTWSDIYITSDRDKINYKTSMSTQIIGHRNSVAIPIGKEYYDVEFLWTVPWIPKLPKGYSLLTTNVMNDTSKPFTTLSGIVDSDNFYHSQNGNLPFYIKSGFTGIIPTGTPMFVMIPIKREVWESKILEYNDDVIKRNKSMYQNFFGSYKNKFWIRKDYR